MKSKTKESFKDMEAKARVLSAIEKLEESEYAWKMRALEAEGKLESLQKVALKQKEAIETKQEEIKNWLGLGNT